MRAYEVGGKGIESLAAVERPEPVAGHGEVVVRIRAASLNYRDLQVARGAYGKNQRRVIPLSDGAGEVASVGSGVGRFKVGDRVAPIFMQTWLAGPPAAAYSASALGGAVDGVLAEKIVLREEGLVAIPPSLGFEQAATLPCAAVTAWNALFESGRTPPGDTVLVQGTGGVSIFVLQLARAAGARVFITSSSDAKLDRARALGADGVCNYKEKPSWSDEATRWNGGAGLDHVIEVGGPGTFDQSLRATRVGGTVSCIGVLTGIGGEIKTALILQKSIRVQGIYVGSRAMFEALLRAVETHGIEPVVDKVFPFDQALEAYRHLESGAHFGKVVISV